MNFNSIVLNQLILYIKFVLCQLMCDEKNIKAVEWEDKLQEIEQFSYEDLKNACVVNVEEALKAAWEEYDYYLLQEKATSSIVENLLLVLHDDLLTEEQKKTVLNATYFNDEIEKIMSKYWLTRSVLLKFFSMLQSPDYAIADEDIALLKEYMLPDYLRNVDYYLSSQTNLLQWSDFVNRSSERRNIFIEDVKYKTIQFIYTGNIFSLMNDFDTEVLSEWEIGEIVSRRTETLFASWGFFKEREENVLSDNPIPARKVISHFANKYMWVMIHNDSLDSKDVELEKYLWRIIEMNGNPEDPGNVIFRNNYKKLIKWVAWWSRAAIFFNFISCSGYLFNNPSVRDREYSLKRIDGYRKFLEYIFENVSLSEDYLKVFKEDILNIIIHIEQHFFRLNIGVMLDILYKMWFTKEFILEYLKTSYQFYSTACLFLSPEILEELWFTIEDWFSVFSETILIDYVSRLPKVPKKLIKELNTIWITKSSYTKSSNDWYFSSKYEKEFAYTLIKKYRNRAIKNIWKSVEEYAEKFQIPYIKEKFDKDIEEVTKKWKKNVITFAEKWLKSLERVKVLNDSEKEIYWDTFWWNVIEIDKEVIMVSWWGKSSSLDDCKDFWKLLKKIPWLEKNKITLLVSLLWISDETSRIHFAFRNNYSAVSYYMFKYIYKDSNGWNYNNENTAYEGYWLEKIIKLFKLVKDSI